MYGIIYAEKEEAVAKREEVKRELAKAYDKHKDPTSEFINTFTKKYKVCLPADTLVDTSTYV